MLLPLKALRKTSNSVCALQKVCHGTGAKAIGVRKRFARVIVVSIVLEINVAFRSAKGYENRSFRGANGDTH